MKKSSLLISALAITSIVGIIFAQVGGAASVLTMVEKMKAASHDFTLTNELNPGQTGLKSGKLSGKKTGEIVTAEEYNRILELLGDCSSLPTCTEGQSLVMKSSKWTCGPGPTVLPTCTSGQNLTMGNAGWECSTAPTTTTTTTPTTSLEWTYFTKTSGSDRVHCAIRQSNGTIIRVGETLPSTLSEHSWTFYTCNIGPDDNRGDVPCSGGATAIANWCKSTFSGMVPADRKVKLYMVGTDCVTEASGGGSGRLVRTCTIGVDCPAWPNQPTKYSADNGRDIAHSGTSGFVIHSTGALGRSLLNTNCN